MSLGDPLWAPGKPKGDLQLEHERKLLKQTQKATVYRFTKGLLSFIFKVGLLIFFFAPLIDYVVEWWSARL